MKTVVGIDNGTQSTKVLFYDFENRTIAGEASAPHALISRDDGTREQEAGVWLEALKACFAEIPPEVRKTAVALGVSGQQHGFVPLDAAGRILRPVKLWCDTSTTEECRLITEAFGGEERLLQGPGNPILPGYTASKILWLKRREPEHYAKMRHILLPHDFLNYFLSGVIGTERGDASGTGLLDIRTGDWHEELIHRLDPGRDLRACLPPVLQDPSALRGTLLPEVAQELGLPPGLPLAPGGGDNMMAAIGTGTVSPGIMSASLGTSGTLFTHSDQAVCDSQNRLAAFCASSGGWLPLLCTMNCTVSTELTRGLFGREVRSFDHLAETAPAGAEGVVTLPFFNGERVPNLPAGKGCLLGLTPRNYTEANLARSALESAVFGLKNGLEAFQEQGLRPREIRLTGGGANSPVWKKILTDILELPMKVLAVKEGPAFGAALQALTVWWKREAPGSGDIGEITRRHVRIEETTLPSPSAGERALYAKAYDEYRSYVRALTPLFS